MIKYKLGAVIPTVQYGNIQPEIELEGEDLQELNEKASAFIEGVWEKYSEKPLAKNLPTEGTPEHFKKLKTFTGEEILYSDSTHKYMDLDMNPLLSGSAYADRNSPKFNKEMMLPKTAKAWGIDAKELDEVWSMNGEVSTHWGNSIHKALELWHKYNKLGQVVKEHKELEDNYVLPKNEYLSNIVKEFDAQFGSNAEVEVLVSDVVRGMAGQIDRLEIIDADARVCRVGDYKTNNDLDDKKLKKYQHQLSFYAHILMGAGWNVLGLDIYHYSDKWQKIELDVLELQ